MPKGNLKASIVRYAFLEGTGWRRGKPVTAKNGRVRPDAMWYGGKEIAIAKDSPYQIRHYVGARTVYALVGTDYELAQAALERLQDTKQHTALEAKLGIKLETRKETPSNLASLRDSFIAKYAHGSADTEYAYRYISTEFVRLMGERGKFYPAALTEDDVIAFDRHLESIGNSKNTRSTRYGYVRCFLRHAGLDPNKLICAEEHKKLKSKPKLAVQTYSEDELQKLYTASSERHRLIWRTFRELGLRDEELAFAFWRDVDLESGVWHVRFKGVGSFPWDRTLTWKSKDSEERDIPIASGLLTELKGHKKYADPESPLVFPTRGGQADIKLLKALKSDWRAAGLNCGHCSGCTKIVTRRLKGKLVTHKSEECSRAKLKTFRSTYLSTMLRFTHVRNVQALAGHSDLKTTQRYLAVDNDAMLKQAANAAFPSATC